MLIQRKTYMNLVGAVIGIAALTGGLMLETSAHASQTHSATVPMSASEIQLATATALMEASSSEPGAAGPVPQTLLTQWPSNVQSVVATTMTRGEAMQYLDNSTVPDPQDPVILVQMRGTFDFVVQTPQTNDAQTGVTSSTESAVVTKNVVTFTVDEASGAILDAELALTKENIPVSTTIFGS